MPSVETVESWATVAAAIATAAAIVVGGGWAVWRYMLPHPFGPDWEVGVPKCAVRRLPSGDWLYIANIPITNASGAVHSLDRALGGIFLPTDKHFEEVMSKGELSVSDPTLVELQSNVRLPPRVRRTVIICEPTKPALHEVALVVWRIHYRRPRWFGVAGERPETARGTALVPVDAQSLALYMESIRTKESN